MMTQTLRRSNRLARLAGQQGARAGVTDSGPRHEKSATEPKCKLLKCKRVTKMSTFNVRTLQSIHQLSELTASAIQHNIDVICVQEHRRLHIDVNLKHHSVGKGWTFISASAWKNSTNSTIGGVGMLLSPQAMKALISIEKITPRVIVATFQGNPRTTVISCYSPTNVSAEEEVETFYEDLSSLVKAIPKHNVLVIGGDLNAQLGPSDQHKTAYHQSTNRNGEHLELFLIENGLLCLNTHFQKRKGKLWTHTYPNGAKAQLDFILLNKKWSNSAQNCEAYNTFYGVSSDHRVVTSRLQLSLRANRKKANCQSPYDWSHLAADEDICNRYTIAVKNRFQALQEEDENTSANVLQPLHASPQRSCRELHPTKT